MSIEMNEVLANLEQIEETEAVLLEPEIIMEPEVCEVMVFGDPFEVGRNLDDCQGDNEFNVKGNCGLLTITNMLRLGGFDVTENDVTKFALENGLCSDGLWMDPHLRGGTTVIERQEILARYGIESSFTLDTYGAGGLSEIARYVEQGHGVNIAVNAGYAWDSPANIGDGSMNHSILVTGTAYDPHTGELKGLYVCDSGLTQQDSKAYFLSVERLQDCYVGVPGACMLVTDQPIR